MAKKEKGFDKFDKFDNEDLDIIEPETYRGEDIKFSHQADVARAIRRIQDTGSLEMSRGWWDFKKHPITGEILEQKHHKDNREEYIESVKNFRDILIDEIRTHPKTKEKITKIEEQENKLYKFWVDEEEKWYLKLLPSEKQKITFIKGMLNPDLQFCRYYMKSMVELFREITRTLHLLLAEIKYYQTVEGEN